MVFVFLLGVLAINIIAVTIIYQIIKKLEKKDILVFIAAGVALLYIGLTIIYWISGTELDSQYGELWKNLLLFSFVPVNAIILMPYLAVKYRNFKTKKTNKRDFYKSVIIVSAIGIILLIIEIFPLKGIKDNIKKTYDELKENTNNSVNVNEITENTNTIKTYQDFLNSNSKTTNTIVE